MIKKNSEINAIEKVQEDIDNQSLSNPRVVQSQRESVAIAPNKIVKKISLILWLAIASGILFIIFNLAIELIRSDIEGGCNPGPPNSSPAQSFISRIKHDQAEKFRQTGAFSNFSDRSITLYSYKAEGNFKYSVRTTKSAAFIYLIPMNGYKKRYFGLLNWREKKVEFNSYIAAVFIVPKKHLNSKDNKKEITTVHIQCKTIVPRKTLPANPILKNGVPTCGTDTKEFSDAG